MNTFLVVLHFFVLVALCSPFVCGDERQQRGYDDGVYFPPQRTTNYYERRQQVQRTQYESQPSKATNVGVHIP